MGLERGGDNLSREMADIHYKEQTMTGNDAASYIAYPALFGLDSLGTSFCDNCFIYPITPSTPMATNADAFASRGLKNVFGQVG